MSLIDEIKVHEGYRSEPYQDHLGYWTVGWGTLIDFKELASFEGIKTFGELMTHLCDKSNHKKWLHEGFVRAQRDAQDFIADNVVWQSLTEQQREVLVEMAYQLGLTNLKKFRNFHAAILDGDDGRARVEMLDSLWHKQTPNRAKALAEKFYPV